jgi:cobyrinic acid a,c-diamide synthase
MPAQTIPRLILAAPMSGSGKTTITAGLIAALTARGLRVAPFKVGPDYIDPSYHALAAGRPCYNLDSWLLAPEQVQALFAQRTQDADLALIEGVMGLFDGVSGDDDSGSAAHLARLLDAPVILVIDAKAMASSAAALVKGFHDFDPRVPVAGVILNRVGSERHARLLQEAIKTSVGIPVLGCLTRDDTLRLPERHLGLVPTHEAGRWAEWLDTLSQKLAASVDLDQVMELAKSARELDLPVANLFTFQHHEIRAKIAVARDAAFNFLYDDNLDLLRAAGAEIAFFSPLNDATLPGGSQALYLCGGFPEIYAAELAANTALHEAVRSAHHAGLPIYAECGGLMYLTEHIIDASGCAFPMVGLLPGTSVMSSQVSIGYRTVRTLHDSWLCRAGETLRGHEFHYSNWETGSFDIPAVYEIIQSSSHREEGIQIGSLIASYVHLHFLAHPELAARMVAAARNITPNETI